MARLGEVPFRRSYGTVDASPLYVMLAGKYFERTGDLATIEEIWPSIEAALQWCDRYGDRDGDGFIEYYRETDQGLANQGWKDSHDSIFHADGSSAEGPIALCEVQGYVYSAEFDHERNTIRFNRPTLPRFVDEIVLRRLRFGSSCFDIRIYQHGCDATINVLAREGDARAVVVK
jgi:glycogen debranching enzyme